MKRRYLSILSALIITTFIWFTPSMAVTVTFSSLGEEYDSGDTIQVYLGQTFEVGIKAQGNIDWGDLAAFGFDFEYSQSLFDIAAEGGPDYSFYVYTPGSTSSPGHFESLIDPSVDPANPDVNAGENVLLATLTLFADSIDPLGFLNISGLLTSGLYHGAYYDNFHYDIEGNLNIEIVDAPVPEPATMLLLGTGLIGMGIAGRRKMKK